VNMKFTSTVVATLALATTTSAFVPATVVSKLLVRSEVSTIHYMSSSVEEEIAEQRKLTKKEKRLEYMQSDKFYRKGFKEVREAVEDVMGTQFKSSTVEDLKSSNYMMERDGVKVYLAKVRPSIVIMMWNDSMFLFGPILTLSFYLVCFVI
jgi:4-hydroxy-3-methylbut-2-en-1-yl diphosphate reductase